MRLTITSEEIDHFRANLASQPDALTALDAIADCEGDLEDAAIGLAIQAGQEPDTNDRWLEGLSKRWRHVLCEADLKQSLEDDLTPELLTALTARTTLPLKLAVPVAIHVMKTGVEPFCLLFESKIQ